MVEDGVWHVYVDDAAALPPVICSLQARDEGRTVSLDLGEQMSMGHSEPWSDLELLPSAVASARSTAETPTTGAAPAPGHATAFAALHQAAAAAAAVGQGQFGASTNDAGAMGAGPAQPAQAAARAAALASAPAVLQSHSSVGSASGGSTAQASGSTAHGPGSSMQVRECMMGPNSGPMPGMPPHHHHAPGHSLPGASHKAGSLPKQGGPMAAGPLGGPMQGLLLPAYPAIATMMVPLSMQMDPHGSMRGQGAGHGHAMPGFMVSTPGAMQGYPPGREPPPGGMQMLMPMPLSAFTGGHMPMGLVTHLAAYPPGSHPNPQLAALAASQLASALQQAGHAQLPASSHLAHATVGITHPGAGHRGSRGQVPEQAAASYGAPDLARDTLYGSSVGAGSSRHDVMEAAQVPRGPNSAPLPHVGYGGAGLRSAGGAAAAAAAAGLRELEARVAAAAAGPAADAVNVGPSHGPGAGARGGEWHGRGNGTVMPTATPLPSGPVAAQGPVMGAQGAVPGEASSAAAGVAGAAAAAAGMGAGAVPLSSHTGPNLSAGRGLHHPAAATLTSDTLQAHNAHLAATSGVERAVGGGEGQGQAIVFGTMPAQSRSPARSAVSSGSHARGSARQRAAPHAKPPAGREEGQGSQVTGACREAVAQPQAPAVAGAGPWLQAAQHTAGPLPAAPGAQEPAALGPAARATPSTAATSHGPAAPPQPASAVMHAQSAGAPSPAQPPAPSTPSTPAPHAPAAPLMPRPPSYSAALQSPAATSSDRSVARNRSAPASEAGASSGGSGAATPPRGQADTTPPRASLAAAAAQAQEQAQAGAAHAHQQVQAGAHVQGPAASAAPQPEHSATDSAASAAATAALTSMHSHTHSHGHPPIARYLPPHHAERLRAEQAAEQAGSCTGSPGPRAKMGPALMPPAPPGPSHSHSNHHREHHHHNHNHHQEAHVGSSHGSGHGHSHGARSTHDHGSGSSRASHDVPHNGGPQHGSSSHTPSSHTPHGPRRGTPDVPHAHAHGREGVHGHRGDVGAGSAGATALHDPAAPDLGRLETGAAVSGSSHLEHQQAANAESSFSKWQEGEAVARAPKGSSNRPAADLASPVRPAAQPAANAQQLPQVQAAGAASDAAQTAASSTFEADVAADDGSPSGVSSHPAGTAAAGSSTSGAAHEPGAGAGQAGEDRAAAEAGAAARSAGGKQSGEGADGEDAGGQLGVGPRAGPPSPTRSKTLAAILMQNISAVAPPPAARPLSGTAKHGPAIGAVAGGGAAASPAAARPAAAVSPSPAPRVTSSADVAHGPTSQGGSRGVGREGHCSSRVHSQQQHHHLAGGAEGSGRGARVAGGHHPQQGHQQQEGAGSRSGAQQQQQRRAGTQSRGPGSGMPSR